MLIKIKNLRLKTILGVYDWEEKINREIIINVKIETDNLKSLQSDNIHDTVDYDALVTKIKNLISQKRFKLVEKMAQEVMDKIMEDKRIKKCKLEIDKVAPVDSLESFSVTIERENGS